MAIRVPARIQGKWGKKGSKFDMTTPLSTAKVSSEDFKKCWKTVRGAIPDNVLFRLLKKTFGQHRNLSGKVDFVKDILRRYKAMGEQVSLTDIPLSLCLYAL